MASSSNSAYNLSESIEIEATLCSPSPIEPPSAILEKLKCDSCSGYLSCPPIYETESGKKVCGRCVEPKETSKRSQLYESLAEMISFPCKFEKYGCTERIKFLKHRNHDELCDFRPYSCPFVSDGTCIWTGSKSQIYDHCGIDHPNKLIVENPKTMKINCCKNLFQTFILHALGKEFIFHIKVCIDSRKIYHSLRCIGSHEPSCLYKIEIMKGNNKIIKSAYAAPQEDLKFSEEHGIAVNFNSLLDVLGPFDEIYSKITVFKKCVECNKIFKRLVFGWLCPMCAPDNISKVETYRSKSETKNTVFS